MNDRQDDFMRVSEPSSKEYSLSVPFLSLTFDQRPDHLWLIAAGLFLLGIAVAVTLIYLYAFVLADWLGFERTVLIGIGILLLGNERGD